MSQAKLTKEEVKEIITKDLKKHFELLARVYDSETDLCLKLTDLVHQCPRK